LIRALDELIAGGTFLDTKGKGKSALESPKPGGAMLRMALSW